MSAQMDPETGLLFRASAESAMNPLDFCAVEAGMQILKRHGGELIALSMGPQSAQETLRLAMALGAGRAILLSDKAFAGADAYVTAFTLSQAIKAIGNVDLVVCGLNTTDGDTAQVPFSLAAQLGWPSFGWVKLIELEPLAFVQEQTGTEARAEARLPMVIAVGRISPPRIPTLGAKLAAKRKPLEVWGLNDLPEKSPEFYGLRASPTRVKKIYATKRERKVLPLELGLNETVKILKGELSDPKAFIEPVIATPTQLPDWNGQAKSGSVLACLQADHRGLCLVSKEMASLLISLSQGRFETHGVFIGSDLPKPLEDELLALGLDCVHVCLDNDFKIFDARPFSEAALACVKALNPAVVLAGATPEGRALAPALAAHLRTGVTADCTGLSLSDNGELLQIRPAFGGDIMAQILTPQARPQIATVRLGAFSALESAKRSRTKIKRFQAPHSQVLPLQTLGHFEDEPAKDLVIAIGGGLRDKAAISLFEKLAEKANASLMCSRCLVERGWFDQSRQIGLSGRSVSPKLLVTFGISGSAQFLSGIKGAKRLVSINLDKDAPILDFADVPLVGDMREIAERCLEM
jgi:electron transfer flavoprotein alpha subunit